MHSPKQCLHTVIVLNKFIIIRLSPEFFFYPLWVKEETDDIPRNIKHHDLEELNDLDIRLLDEYQNLFQNTYNAGYPPESRFKDQNEENYFNDLSINIGNILKSKYPQSKIIRWDILKNTNEEVAPPGKQRLKISEQLIIVNNSLKN